jgi:protein SCO1
VGAALYLEEFSMPDEERSSRPIGKGRLAVLAAGGLLAGILIIWLATSLISGRSQNNPPSFNGAVIPSTDRVADFTLTAHTGQKVSLSDFRDQVVLLYFGYTYCPDVCPATLATLAQAVAELSTQDQEKVQVLMVTVDPDRDTAGVLAAYLPHFNDRFLGLTGTDEEIVAAARPFGIYYQKQEGTEASGYLVDHTASVMVVDQDGYLRLIFPFATPAADIAADLQQLVRE